MQANGYRITPALIATAVARWIRAALFILAGLHNGPVSGEQTLVEEPDKGC